MDSFEAADQLLDAGDGKAALAMFERVAERDGRVSAMHSIAHTYLYGIAGVERNYQLAFKWFSRAAQGGCPQAMYHLGLCHSEGYGVPKNPGQSYSWYKKSAELDDEDAAFRVGGCLEEGFGVEKNLEKAREWYRAAAGKGQSDAIRRLAELDGKK
ncbi:MAG: sel1 repeat family protein [Planctomycetota bacterium]|jgi:TPR repeat protein|nr:sel1 repeat family protein [Planctomycetota bacterium]